MPDYIEREAAVKAAQDGADEWDGGYNRNRDAYIECAIDNVPAADVVEVVRCKDCRHSYLEPYAAGIAHRICAYGMGANCEVKDDFYCAFGVKTDESEFVKDIIVLDKNESEDEE